MHGQRRVLQAWLKDAHAMERATVDNLERQLRRLEDAEVRSALAEHLERSKAQVGRLEGCLRSLGAEPSLVKDAATRFTGMAETWLAGASPDEAVKNCIATYAYEQFEVVCYEALAVAAEACGEAEIKRMCDEAVEEERSFAERLRGRLPSIVRRHLDQEGARKNGGVMADLGVVARRNPVPVAALAAAGLGAVAVAAAGARRLMGGGAISTFEDLYIAELQELRSSEHRLENLLGRLTDAARDNGLRGAFVEHGAASRAAGWRLEQMIGARRRDPRAHTDQAMQALVRETEKMMGQLKGAALTEAGLIASVQMIAHYQIAGYGSAAAWAGKLGYAEDQRALHEVVEQKKQLDAKLSELAEHAVNHEAAAAA